MIIISDLISYACGVHSANLLAILLASYNSLVGVVFQCTV